MKRIIQITSGKGPAECCWVVAQVLKKILLEAGKESIPHKIIHRELGEQNGTLKAATIEFSGDKVDNFLKSWIGTIQWIGQSKFRKLHKRKNWFIGINELQKVKTIVDIHDSDIRYEFTRSGGPGGQNVNKVSTAVRAIHITTGEVVFVSNGRSQFQNKKEAKVRLQKKLEEKLLLETKERIKDEWVNHNQLERGNPIRVFKGSDFKPNHMDKKYRSNRKSSKQKMLKRLDE